MIRYNILCHLGIIPDIYNLNFSICHPYPSHGFSFVSLCLNNVYHILLKLKYNTGCRAEWENVVLDL